MIFCLPVLLSVWCYFGLVVATEKASKNVIVDTDIFSDCDDTAALLLAATSPGVNLLGVNVNSRSSYSALAASAILAHYGRAETPIGARRPLTNDTFFDNWLFSLGEFASKVAYHWSGGALPWGRAEDAWDPVVLYRKLLAEAADDSVTIVSIGFLANLSGLLNSTADSYSGLSGVELVAAKVQELVVMGGEYPFGREFNFWGDDPHHTAHVVNNWKGRMVFSGSELGGNVFSGGALMAEDGPAEDPARAAYLYYTYGHPRQSWDPLTMLYATGRRPEFFRYGNVFGYNTVSAVDGSNAWVFDEAVTNQHWLELKVSNTAAAAELDRAYLEGALKWAGRAPHGSSSSSGRSSYGSAQDRTEL